ncbi:bromodomain and WD repeat-containing protein 1-like [Zophobas morio]|uniref:bromodomain and WD repeat-containing protein 1-like n=1 Tax=Zophobas morio TaxID=2755281 RepID=UPI003082E7B1
MALSANNEMLATCAFDHRVIVWRMKSGTIISILEGNNHPHIHTVAFSPTYDRDSICVASTGFDGSVRFWRLEKHVKEPTLTTCDEELKFVYAAHFDERKVVVNNTIRDDNEVCCSCFSPGGLFFAAGDECGRVLVYHVPQHLSRDAIRLVNKLNGHSMRVSSLQFSNAGDRLLSGSSDGRAIIWRFSSNELDVVVLNCERHVVTEAQVLFYF